MNKNKNIILKVTSIIILIIGIIFFGFFISYRIKASNVDVYAANYYDNFRTSSVMSFIFFAVGSFLLFFLFVILAITRGNKNNHNNMNNSNFQNKTFKNIQTDGNNHFSSNGDICPYCGNEIFEGSYCPNCGSKIR